MVRTVSLLLTVLLLVALGYTCFSLRADAASARQMQLAELQRRNAVLADESARLDAFLHSPLCRDMTAAPVTP